MTFAEDFLDEEKGLEGDYPTAFGITFTPMVIGIALGILGIVGFGYIQMNITSKAKTKYKGVQTQLDQKQAKLAQMKQPGFDTKVADLKSDLADQKALKSRVMAMFTNQDDLETLLIDLNNFIAINQGELVKYNPESSVSVINDDSLGADVKGKLKRKGFTLDVKGTYSQTQSILQDIERLQPLLMINSYSSKVSEQPTAILTNNSTELIPQDSAILTTNLKLDAILPLSQSELEAARKAEAKAKLDSENEGGGKKRQRRNRK